MCLWLHNGLVNKFLSLKEKNLLSSSQMMKERRTMMKKVSMVTRYVLCRKPSTAAKEVRQLWGARAFW